MVLHYSETKWKEGWFEIRVEVENVLKKEEHLI